MLDVKVSGWGTPTGPFDVMREFLTPPTYPDLNYKIDYGESSVPQDAWWYVAQEGDVIASTDNVYQNILDAIDAAELVGNATLLLLTGDPYLMPA